MILALDVGNTQTYGGVFDTQHEALFHFRYSSIKNSTSDETGLFLKNVLRENNFDPAQINHITIGSVVPHSVYSLRNACIKYFGIRPFLLEAGVKTGLKIKYKNPTEVGADRIANAIAATTKYPNQNLIVADFGTATTFCAIKKSKSGQVWIISLSRFIDCCNFYGIEISDGALWSLATMTNNLDNQSRASIS